MAGGFEWRDATRHDRPLLQGFSCTPDPGRTATDRPLPYQRPWERDVEAWIRVQTPPAGPGEALRIETDDVSVQAVAALVLADERQAIAIVKIQAIAVSLTVRGGDGTIADAAMTEALSQATRLSAAAGYRRTIVVAWVDERNLESQRLLGRSGFARFRRISEELFEWALVVVVGDETAVATRT